MKIIGIIGPYISGGYRRYIEYNIANAQFVAIAIANYFKENQLVGFFCPHTHTARFEKLADAPEGFYHALDDAIYDRACDGFILLPNWKMSIGATRDYKRALKNKKEIFELPSYETQDINNLLQTIKLWAKTGRRY